MSVSLCTHTHLQFIRNIILSVLAIHKVHIYSVSGLLPTCHKFTDLRRFKVFDGVASLCIAPYRGSVEASYRQCVTSLLEVEMNS